MEKEELLTANVSSDTMAEVFAANHPGIFPTKAIVGRWAKSIGYKHTKQMVNRKIVWYYLKVSE